MNQNKKQEAFEVIIRIAAINERLQKITQIRDIILKETERTQENEASCKNVFKILKQTKYIKPIIFLAIIYGTGNLSFYGVSYSLNMEGLGYGYNSIIFGCVQIITYISLYYSVNYIPRRIGIAVCYGIVMVIDLSFSISYINQNHVLGTIFLGFQRFFSSFAYTLIACIQTQVFTVQIQSTAVGLVESFSLVSVFMAPMIVNISDKVGINPIVMIAFWVNFAI